MSASKPANGRARSDQRIFEDVCEALRRDPEVDASNVEVRVEHGTVTLAGWAEDRPQKKRAEFVARAIRGVEDVLNELRLVPPSGETTDFADERGPLATEFGSRDASRATRSVNSDDRFHGD